jgi:hypothetical protein
MASQRRNRTHAAWSAAIAMAIFLSAGQAVAQSSAGPKVVAVEKTVSRGSGFCAGRCAVHLYGGFATSTSMTSMFALDDVATFAPEKFVAPWDWDYTGSGLIAGAVSSRLITIAGIIDIEGEAGVGQRFGHMHETEFWAALYARWTWFPWNHIVRTSIATSTGLNFATGVPWAERQRDANGRGSKLLHFFSPEITLGLPSQPEWDLVARIHHRSGARVLFGDLPLFNGVDGGVHFATLGVRYRF